MMRPSTAIVQLILSMVMFWFSSRRVGIRNIREVTKSQTTEIQPRGIESPLRSKELFLKVAFDTVSLRRIGIA